MDLINTGEGPLTTTTTVIYDGDQDPNRSLRSPDNLDWADDGFIYVQEDEAEEDSLTGEFLFGQGAVNPNEASILRIDPNASAEDAAVGANVQTIAIVDRSQILDPTVADPTTAVDEDFERTEDGIFGGGEVLVTDPSGNEVILDAGEWETSGIIDVSNLFDEGPGSVFLFNVQAHGLADQDDVNLEQGDQSALIDDILAEGGQLLLLLSPELSTNNQLVFGSAGDDDFEAGLKPGFDGERDLVFAGAGEDLIDLSLSNTGSRIYSGGDNDEVFAGEDDRVFGGPGEDILDGSVGEGDNRLYGGDGDDELYAGENDRLFGNGGDDILDASVGEGNNRLYGGDGDDLFFLGEGDRLVGGEGDDSFFVSTGGDNIISGGEGADAFWVATAGSLPDESNVITDFDPLEDVIGAGGFSVGDLSFGEEDNNAILSISGEAVATFLGVSQGDLESANFAF